MKKTIFLSLSLLLLAGAGPLTPAPTQEMTPSVLLQLLDPQKRYDAACCKICRKGKACGDSCIRQDYRCRKGVGCACDG